MDIRCPLRAALHQLLMAEEIRPRPAGVGMEKNDLFEIVQALPSLDKTIERCNFRMFRN